MGGGRGEGELLMIKQNPKLTAYARSMRKEPTDAENKLWHFLRAKRFNGLKFRRQQPFKHYIVDFICHDCKLIIELDGGQHNELDGADYDRQRTILLEQEGYKVLRFWNHDVLKNIEGVLQTIYLTCHSELTLPLAPSHQGSGDL
jgi:very-short-patch-repair endonuclease